MEQDPPEEAESTLLDDEHPSTSNRPVVSRPGDNHSQRSRRSKQASYDPSQRSEWEGHDSFNVRYQQRGLENYEDEYQPTTTTTTTTAVPVSSLAAYAPPDSYAPNELESSFYPYLPATLDSITAGVANYNLNTSFSTQANLQVQTKGLTVDEERLDSHYKVHASWQFKVGKVFKVLWAEPRGAGGASMTSSLGDKSLEKESIHSIRRFIIVKSMTGHCVCLPIMTYGRRGTAKKGVNAATHTIIYSGNTPAPLSGEHLTRRPIRITPFGPQHKLDTASRLNYAKVYTIEFNIKVYFVGVIHDDSKDRLLKDFAEVQGLQLAPEYHSNNEPPSQPTHKMLDSAYQMASRKFFKKGRVFSTPHPEVAGPSTTESNEITLDPYHNKLHTKIRRFIVVRDMSSHCLCVPVNTYGGRENYTAKPQDQRQLFPAVGNWDKSRIAKKELPLVVEASGADVDYSLASVDFTRILTIKHYALVKKIGRIDKLGLPLLEECFRNALGMPLELDDTNPAFVSMFSPTHLKWYGLIAGVRGDYEENFISRNVVDRLRLRFASEAERQWADGVERPSVTATFTVARDQVSQLCLFHVVDSLDYDVCFGRAFVEEHSDRYTQLYNMMYPSGGLYSNQLASPERSTHGFMLSPPSHSLMLAGNSNDLSEYITPSWQPQNSGAYYEDVPPGEDISTEEARAEEHWQEVNHRNHAHKGKGSASPAQYGGIYDG